MWNRIWLHPLHHTALIKVYKDLSIDKPSSVSSHPIDLLAVFSHGSHLLFLQISRSYTLGFLPTSLDISCLLCWFSFSLHQFWYAPKDYSLVLFFILFILSCSFQYHLWLTIPKSLSCSPGWIPDPYIQWQSQHLHWAPNNHVKFNMANSCSSLQICSSCSLP